jgi:hypothetical protein
LFTSERPSSFGIRVRSELRGAVEKQDGVDEFKFTTLFDEGLLVVLLCHKN